MSDERSIDRLSARMAELQRELLARDRSSRHDRMRAAVLAGVHTAGASRRPAISRRPWALALASAALAVLAVLAWPALRPTPLTFRLDGAAGAVEAEALVVADGDGPLTMTFSDGSAVVLERGSRVRVGARRVDGAELVLEQGRLEARLREHDAGAWRILAGPYEVVVLGDALVLGWSPEVGGFELTPLAGRVEVRGPSIEGTRVLDPGEQLRVDVASHEPVVARGGDAGEPPGVVAPPHEHAAVAAVEASPRASTSGADGPERGPARPRGSARVKPPPGETTSWRSLAHDRRWSEALRVAEAHGFAALCDSLSADALLELADVGRYAGARARAREALLALRRRFAGSDAAAAAAFDLGRLDRDCAEATAWFRSYLRERPQGAMATAATRRIAECDADRSHEPSP